MRPRSGSEGGVVYVCICNGYRETEIIAAARAGAQTAEEAYHCLGSGPNCRRCLMRAQCIIDADRADTVGACGCGPAMAVP